MDLRVAPYSLPVEWPQAHARTGIVLVQPEVSLDLSQAGYRLRPELESVQVQILASALDLARQPVGPDLSHSHFTVLPEYALPARRFAACEALVQELLPANAVCIAGFDAMDPDQFRLLAAGAANRKPLVTQAQGQHDWVNTAAIWAKDPVGRLHRFLQAKIRPNPQEGRAGQMYRGQEILYFNAGCRTFAILLCYDLIATLDEGTVPQRLWQWLQVHTAPEGPHPQPAFLFVIQDNQRPTHTDFTDSARLLLTNPGTRFDLIAFVNRAGPSGQTTLFCAKGDWPPTEPETPVDDVPRLHRRLRVGDSQLTQMPFRNGGPCAHRFIYQPKSALPRAAGAPREPLDYARLYPIQHGQIVAEGVSPLPSQYAVREALTEASPQASRPQPLVSQPALLAQLESAFQTVAQAFDTLPPARLHAILDALLNGCGRANPDFWEENPELRAVRRLIEAVYVLRAGGIASELDGPLHPHITADCEDFTLTVLAGDGDTCPEYLFGGLLDRPYDPRPHLFLLLDHLGLSAGPQAVRINPREVARLGAGCGTHPVHLKDDLFGSQEGEERIDAPGLYWLDRRSLLQLLRTAPDAPAFSRMLMEVLPWRTA